jgi:hypothetical protein
MSMVGELKERSEVVAEEGLVVEEQEVGRGGNFYSSSRLASNHNPRNGNAQAVHAKRAKGASACAYSHRGSTLNHVTTRR